jgi:hypothetical protein
VEHEREVYVGELRELRLARQELVTLRALAERCTCGALAALEQEATDHTGPTEEQLELLQRPMCVGCED